MDAAAPDSPSLLIVDDNPNNLRVLEGILRAGNYRVRAALNGESALRAIEASRPDLVMLDIRMPVLDGYEVCRRIKAMPASRDVPVIFISALQEMDDKVLAFQAGGVDYIVKPFQAEEVLARARTHIELAKTRQALADSNAHLEELVSRRTAALAASNAQLERVAREEHALRELLALSHVHSSVEDFLNHALSNLSKSMNWTAPAVKSAILLTRSDANPAYLELVASEGFASVESGRHFPLRPCIRTDGSICVEHADSQVPCYLRELLDAPHTHAMCVPIVSEEQMLGLLLLAFSDKPADSNDGFLVQVAGVLGTSIARRYATEQIAWLAYHDDLTGLPNRRQLSEQLNRELPGVLRRNHRLAVAIVDLDHFKRLNEALGHSAGDRLLKAMAGRLQAALRGGDALYRWGGDEFVVVFHDIGDDDTQAAANAHTAAGKVAALIAAPLRLDDLDAHLVASIGIAMFPGDGDTAEELMKHADLAMHQAKQAGRNAIHFYKSQMQQEAEHRLILEKELRVALAENQFTVHYQPQVDRDGRIIGGEALVRWQHPGRGLVAPGLFIAAAEDMGLIVALGEWVLQQACRHLNAWAHHPHLRLAVNVSPRQFHQDDFVANVRHVIESSGTDPARIELEVTEGLLLADIDGAVAKMNALRALGVRFAVDDFGTGYSSLGYLRSLPVDQLKIDRSFVTDIHHDERNAAIARTIVSLAQNLGMKTIAEGVERREEVEFLRTAGCDRFQGYYFGKPMTAEEFAQRL